MKIIILEGTSASGKTTLANKLANICAKKNLNCKLVDEGQTLMPVLGKFEPEIFLDHLTKLVKDVFSEEYDVVIFDRLHLTAMAISNSTVEKYKELEKILLQHNPTIVFLKIDEKEIPERIANAAKHRDSAWRSHLATHGSKKEINQHYIGTQRKLLEHLESSSLPKIIFDSTEQNYDKIAEEIKL